MGSYKCAAEWEAVHRTSTLLYKGYSVSQAYYNIIALPPRWASRSNLDPGWSRSRGACFRALYQSNRLHAFLTLSLMPTGRLRLEYRPVPKSSTPEPQGVKSTALELNSYCPKPIPKSDLVMARSRLSMQLRSSLANPQNGVLISTGCPNLRVSKLYSCHSSPALQSDWHMAPYGSAPRLPKRHPSIERAASCSFRLDSYYSPIIRHADWLKKKGIE